MTGPLPHPRSQLEMKVGMRCGCGTRIEKGIEFYIHETHTHPETREIIPVLNIQRCCGAEDCPVTQALASNAVAKRPCEIEWLVGEVFPHLN